MELDKHGEPVQLPVGDKEPLLPINVEPSDIIDLDDNKTLESLRKAILEAVKLDKKTVRQANIGPHRKIRPR